VVRLCVSIKNSYPDVRVGFMMRRRKTGVQIWRKKLQGRVGKTAIILSLGIIAGLIMGNVMRGTSSDAWALFSSDQPSATAVSSAVMGDQPFVPVAARVTPAVVNISTTRTVKGGVDENQLAPFYNDPFFRRFFGDREPGTVVPHDQKEQSLGSGVIVDPRGYIITNNHVIDKADSIKVVLSDRREFKGKLIGTDPKTDIAVVKIDGNDLPTIPWGDSSQLKTGQYVLAVGNPFGLNQTVTMGIISAVGRANIGIADYEDFIQTDAAINPGNSGGALVNTAGELIGINTAIFSQSGGYMGIGFAVPSKMARAVMESLIKTGKVVRGWLGVSIQEVTPALAKQFGLADAKGALISDVLSGTPAERAGLKRGDVIVKVNGKSVDGPGHLRNTVAETAVGEKMTLTVIREGHEKAIAVTIGEQPKDLAQHGAEEESSGQGSAALDGVEVKNLTPQTRQELNLSEDISGVVVNSVESDSAAEMAGLQRGDVIMEVDRKTVHNTREYEQALSHHKGKEGLLLLINRQGSTIFVMIGASP
jgi:serine protease Do